MVMLRQLQNSLNKSIERFQDRWETQPSFRATWSIIGGVFAILFICSSLLISLNIANSLTSGTPKPASGPNANVLYSGASGQQTPRPVAQASPNITPTPGANPIATSNAPTPTPTASPTPGDGTPGVGTPGVTGTPGNGTPTATLPPNEYVNAVQQPASGWVGSAQNNQIDNVVTSPAVQNVPIVFTIDFRCASVTTDPVQLDNNGKASNIPVKIPDCFKAQTTSTPVIVTVTISGQTVTFTPATPFIAKGQ